MNISEEEKNRIRGLHNNVIKEQSSADALRVYKDVIKHYGEDRTGITNKLYPNGKDLASAIADGYKYWDRGLKGDFGRLQMGAEDRYGILLPSLSLMEYIVDTFKK
jgi:hypothetical protein